MFSIIFLFLLAGSANGYLIEECMNFTIYPIQYDLTIKPYIFSNGSSYYLCDITISVIANAPGIKVIELDAQDLRITEGSIKVFDKNTDIVNGARPFEVDHRKEKIYIHLREPLRIYDKTKDASFVYKIQMSFVKIVQLYEDQKSQPGIFLVEYFEPANPRKAKYLYTTRFELNKAKSAFPCFENPRFEAGFKIKVYMAREQPDLQRTNTSLTISEELKRESSKEYEVIQYMQSQQVALHQLGFHFSEFANIQQSASHTNDTLYVWAPSKDLHHYNFVLNYGVTIIDLIHEFSRTRRPITNGPVNLIAVPAKLEGYEASSWNLLTNSAYKLANEDHLTSIKQLERLKFELALQLSRLWLGNPGESIVTRWREEWFKEGMANYLAYYLLAQQNNYGSRTSSSTRPLDYYGLKMKHQAMSYDVHYSTPALITFNNTLAVEIPSRYKRLVATKTAALWWMLDNWLQTDQLHASFVKYINRMRGQYISLWDLIGAIDKDTVECQYQFANGSTPTRILESWFHQRGYPVVTVNVLRDRTPNAIQLKQRLFSFNAEHRKPTEFLIPISYLVQSNKNCFNCQPRFIIGQTYTFSENLNGGWIILNSNASGYYRVNYDTETWKLIAAALKLNPLSINELNRAQIVNDVFALYMSGDIDRLLAEGILLYLDNERSLIVWEAAIDGFNMLRIKNSNTQVTKNLYWEWEEFMGKRVMRIFQQLVHNNDKSPKMRLFRSQIIAFATEINYEPCLKYIRSCYQEYSSGRASLDPDIREAAFYVSENSTRSNNNINNMPHIGYIEEEDKISAEHKVREKNGFLIHCPYGEPRPLPIISTETPITSVSVTEKLEKPLDASSSTTNSPIFFVTCLIYFSLLLLK